MCNNLLICNPKGRNQTLSENKICSAHDRSSSARDAVLRSAVARTNFVLFCCNTLLLFVAPLSLTLSPSPTFWANFGCQRRHPRTCTKSFREPEMDSFRSTANRRSSKWTQNFEIIHLNMSARRGFNFLQLQLFLLRSSPHSSQRTLLLLLPSIQPTRFTYSSGWKMFLCFSFSQLLLALFFSCCFLLLLCWGCSRVN